MRCYLVQGGGRKRYAGTQASSKEARDEIVTETDIKKSEVEIEETEIPMDKPSLLEFINDLCTQLDAPSDLRATSDGEEAPAPTAPEETEEEEDKPPARGKKKAAKKK